MLQNPTDNIIFTDWMAYGALPEKIATFDLCMGIMGEEIKTQMVVPNKIFTTLLVRSALSPATLQPFDL